MSSIGKSASEGWEAYCGAMDGDCCPDPTLLEQACQFAEEQGAEACREMLIGRQEPYGCDVACEAWIALISPLPTTPVEHLDAMRAAFAEGWSEAWESDPISAARCIRNARQLANGDC